MWAGGQTASIAIVAACRRLRRADLSHTLWAQSSLGDVGVCTPVRYGQRMRAVTRLSHLAFLVVAALTAPLLPGCEGCDSELNALRAALIVEPGEAAVAGVPVAQDTLLTFTLPNRRQADLTGVVAILGEDSDIAFSLVENTVDRVVPGATGTLVVKVRPVVEGTIKALLIVDSDDTASPDHVEVPITVTAIDVGLPDIEVSPADGVFFSVIGRADVGRETLTIKNVGIRDLVIDEITIPAEPFRLVACPPPGHVLGQQESVACIITFRPPDTKLYTSSITIKSNDPDEAEVVVPISAQAVECPTAVAVRVDEEEFAPFDTIRLDGRGSFTTAEGTSIPPAPDGYFWQLVEQPIGSTTQLRQLNNETTDFVADLAGFYQVQLTVFAVDDDQPGNGLVRSCAPAVVDIEVVPEDDLHIQLVWGHDTADFDLHVVREGGSLFNHDGDAYFSNRLPEQTPTTPSWSLNLDENPRLDHDDARGYGPENVNIKHPAPGTRWTVYVHYWNAQAAAEAATATLRVYVFGRQAIELSQSFESDQLMWKALEIVWGDDPLASPVLTQLGQVNPYVRPF